jgi:hypothetical protein
MRPPNVALLYMLVFLVVEIAGMAPMKAPELPLGVSAPLPKACFPLYKLFDWHLLAYYFNVLCYIGELVLS